MRDGVPSTSVGVGSMGWQRSIRFGDEAPRMTESEGRQAERAQMDGGEE